MQVSESHSPTNTSQPRNRHVDLLRGISILMVMLLHAGFFVPNASMILPPKLTVALARNGYLGVTLFFVISGYLITQTSLRRYGNFAEVRVGQFVLYRMSRILPALILLVAVNVALLWAQVDGFKDLHGIPLSRILLYVFSFRFNVLVVDGAVHLLAWAVLWSLAIEEVFYLVFPIVSRLARTRRVMCALLCVVIVQGFIYRLQSHAGIWVLYAYRACFDSLALGCAVATVTQDWDWSQRHPRLPAYLRLGGLAAIFALWLSFDINTEFVWLPTAISVCAAVFLFGSATDAARTNRGPFERVLRVIDLAGYLSYELYLFHIPALLLLQPLTASINRAAHGRLPRDVFFVAVVPLMLAASFAMHRYLFEPSRIAARRLADRFLPS